MKCMLQVYLDKDNLEYMQNNAFNYIKYNFIQNEILDILLADYNQYLERKQGDESFVIIDLGEIIRQFNKWKKCND